MLCYIASWNPKFKAQDLNPDLCTMTVACYGRLNEDGSLREGSTQEEIRKSKLGQVPTARESVGLPTYPALEPAGFVQ